MSDKKRMSNRIFRAILIPIIVVLFAGVLGVTIAMNSFSKVMNFYFGAGEMVITSAKGREDWNAEYYNRTSGSKKAATEKAVEVSEKIQNEGTILLKNKNNALPLDPKNDKEKKVSAFGWSFSYPVYGGTGSNKLDFVDYVTPQKGLENAGFTVNTALTSEYTTWAQNTTYKGITGTMDAVTGKYTDITCDERPINQFGYANWDIIEMPMTASLASSAADYSDVALVFLSRQGGENGDLPTTMGASTFSSRDGSNNFGFNENKHYLQLSDDEVDMIDKVTAAGFEKVVVVLNSLNVMQVDDLENNDKIDSILWVGGTGERGFNSLGKILSGEVNPSAKTANIWAADFTEDPTFCNYADPDHYEYKYMRNITALRQSYSNINNTNTPYKGQMMIQYEEGVYLGYRYFETAHVVDQKGFNYADAVTYPFGYGLSYTNFTQRITGHSIADGNITINVEVTNSGKRAGKETVEIYYSAPYGNETTNPVKMEKSTVVLGGFAKTKLLGAGEKDNVTVVLPIEDMASYDYISNKCYVLDDGDYTISLRNDSHNIVSYENKPQTFVYKNNLTRIFNDKNDGARESEKNAQEDHLAVEENYTAATNAFDDILLKAEMDKMSILSRGDKFEKMPSAVTLEERTASEDLIKALAKFEAKEDADAVMPVLGAKKELDLVDLRGRKYEDPAWDTLLNQLTVDDMLLLIEFGYGSEEIKSINAPKTYAADSPQCLQANYWSGVAGADSALLNAYPCSAVIACTWNVALTNEMGEAIGEEGVQWGIAGWYAPGLNIHRSPFGGRNFEYFSEDAIISGKLCAAMMEGASTKGLLGYVKHFALNDQESFRQGYLYALNNGACTWADEQTIRELYLKPFEIVVKEAKMKINYIKDADGNWGQTTMSACVTVMSAFNRIGYEWAGGLSGLLQQILRNEWGFRGQVMTDFRNTRKAGGEYYYMDKDQMLRNGGDSILATTIDREGDAWQDMKSKTAVSYMRTASKNILYAIVHSNGMQGITPGAIVSTKLAVWQILLIVANVLIYTAIAGGIVCIILRTLNEKKYPDKYKNRKRDKV